MKKIIPILAAMLTFAACTKEGDVIYQTDPADAPSAKPLVTVIYDPNGVGDGNYNDLIYQGVEQAAREHGLRTMQLSPSTREEGLAYLETLFQQMSVAQDTVRRLFIVAAASYDDYLRRNDDRLAANPYTGLLYLETSKPLTGKGSTLCLPYYGAMYEAGGLAQALATEVLLVAANPKVESVCEAVDGFTDGFNSDYIQYPDGSVYTKALVTEYLSDDVAGGFSIADTTAIHIMSDREWGGYFNMLVPVCGGAARTFQHLNDLVGGYDLAGVNVFYESINSSLSVIKHIDRAVGPDLLSGTTAGSGLPAAIVDYDSRDLSASDIADILMGRASARLPIVLPQGEGHNVLFYWSGHGRSQSQGGADEFVWRDTRAGQGFTADMLRQTAEQMQFRKLCIAAEPCYGERVIRAVEGIPGVLAMSGASAAEQSWADHWNNDARIWMCDRFSLNLVNCLSDNPDTSFRDLFLYCAQHTLGSHAKIVNADHFGNLFTTGPAEFILYNKK